MSLEKNRGSGEGLICTFGMIIGGGGALICEGILHASGLGRDSKVET